MIQEIAKSRKLKKITMAASVAAMGIGLVTSLSSFEGTGAGGSGSGIFRTEVYFKQTCGAYVWAKTEYKNSYGQIIGRVEYRNGLLYSGQVMAEGTYASSTSSSGSGAASIRDGWSCKDEAWNLCTPCPDPCGGCS